MGSYKYYFLYIFWLLLLFSCGSGKIEKNSSQFIPSNYFSGLYVYDITTDKAIIDRNSNHYFTPASTVKLFTLYTALKTLPDSIATVTYHNSQDGLYIKALADPSFLYDSLPNSTFDFLKNIQKDIILIPDEFHDFVYGDGWQWDDYQYYYMPEKSLFPIYGNLTTLEGETIYPSYFQNQLETKNASNIYRDFLQNTFYKDSIGTDMQAKKIPFKTSIELSRQLLSDTLQKPVYLTNELEEVQFTPYISTPTYPIYKKLMDESENFIAEQLFLVISKQQFNTYQVENTIQLALDSLIPNIPHKPRWVDASGLSRYNLFTPKSMVFILEKMYKEFGETKLLDLLPQNGTKGSLQKWYPFETTYLYAKTGSLSNNHNICGFIKTKKGKLLIFSYMSNNFVEKSSNIRAVMNKELLKIYNSY